MKIGITGGSGFIGNWVAQRAIDMGHFPIILDRTGDLSGAAGALLETRQAALFLGDVRDPVALTELAAHVDGIIHLAACLGTQETVDNPLPAAETNIVGGLNFLQACRQYGIPGVYIGVGNHWMENSYSITKTTVERFVRMFNAEHGTRVNVVRLVNAYGPGQSVAPPFGPAKVRKITPAFVCRALTGQPIEIYGDGEQVSDMVHVSDGATALILALEKAAEGVVFGKAVEVGPARSLTVNQVAEIVRQAAAVWRVGQNLDYGCEPVGIVHLPMRPGEIPGARVTADHTTLSYIGMDARDLIGAEEGLAATVKWYAENWLPDYLRSQNAAQTPAQRAAEPELAVSPAYQRLLGAEPDPAGLPGGNPPAPRQVPAGPAVRDPEGISGGNGSTLLPEFLSGQAHGQDH